MSTAPRPFANRRVVVAILMLAGVARPAPAQDEPPGIVVHVDDYAALPRKLLLQAESLATTVYRSAGVETQWVNRTMPREQHSEGSPLAGRVSDHAVHLRVIILSEKMTRRKLRDSPHGSNVLGLAQAAPELAHSVAFVFFARVEHAADRHAEATSDVVAHVMAHEIGHLILVAGGHSENGIMRDAWDPKELRRPLFSPEQAALIRATLLHYLTSDWRLSFRAPRQGRPVARGARGSRDRRRPATAPA